MKKNTQILGIGSLGGLALYAIAVMPLVAFAQTADLGYFTNLGNDVITLINDVMVPLVFAAALVMFIWGMFMTFIVGGSDPEKQKQGRDLMLWGIIAFFVMVSVWGLVNILTGITGIDAGNAPTAPTAPTT